MAKGLEVTINLKTASELRNQFSGKLRTRGTTMKSFLNDVMELVATDEAFFEMLEVKRHSLQGKRNSCQAKEMLEDDLVGS